MFETSLRNVDLNLLLAFSTLMRERSVSRAAARLHIGQSGMSGALARLRRLFDDPLLLRVGRALEPTPRALALVGEVDAALATIERALDQQRAFDPAACRRSFAVGMTDDNELLHAGPLAAALARQAPHARLVFRSFDTFTFRAALDDGSIDLGLTVSDDIPSWQATVDLHPLEYLCLFSARRLPGWRRVTLERFVATPHALVTFRGQLDGPIDEELRRRGLRRTVLIGVSRFGALPGVLESLPILTTVPAPVARHLARTHRLTVAPPPLSIPARTMRLLYRRRDMDLPELAWFRDLVRDVVRRSG